MVCLSFQDGLEVRSYEVTFVLNKEFNLSEEKSAFVNMVETSSASLSSETIISYVTVTEPVLPSLAILASFTAAFVKGLPPNVAETIRETCLSSTPAADAMNAFKESSSSVTAVAMSSPDNVKVPDT